MNMASLSFSDLYGQRTPGAVGPNTESTENVASGNTGATGTAPAMVWIGMVLALVLLRLAWHFSK